MDEIIMNVSATAALCLGFRTQEEMTDIADDMEDVEHNDIKEEEEVIARSEIGVNVDSSSDAEFKFLHVFTKIESSEKWTEVRLALAKTKDDVYNPNAHVSGEAEGWPDGNKKAKAARDSAPAAEQL
ncbi:putative methionyl-tRNA synthetase [Hordeum vulgare]|nr:putative methionyl-tRNA synthetase [Hordeum vulgare]